MTLDPQVRKLLDWVEKAGGPDYTAIGAAAARTSALDRRRMPSANDSMSSSAAPPWRMNGKSAGRAES